MHVHVKVINRAFRVGCSTGTESDPCLMALSLETAYSRAHSDGPDLIGEPEYTLMFKFNVDLECDLIELNLCSGNIYYCCYLVYNV